MGKAKPDTSPRSILIIGFASMALFGCYLDLSSGNPDDSPSAPDSPKEFMIGVFLQDPTAIHDGKTLAQSYAELGVNTFVGLWHWPSGEDMGEGWGNRSMQAIKDAGLSAYAGNDASAVDWINANPSFEDSFRGYYLGDEPDMNKVNGNPDDSPDGWKAKGLALGRLDGRRHEIYGNFGKGFAIDPWVGYHIDDGSTKEIDFAKYVDPCTVISSDFYGITDPWEPLSSHGVWSYGRAIDNDVKYSGGRRVWGVLEASNPWGDGENAANRAANQMHRSMPPELVMPVVWNMVVHGAQGYGYFCHRFSDADGVSYCGALLEPGMPEAMKAANESVLLYERPLMAESVPGTTVTVTPPDTVAVTTLTKAIDGYTYVFAMGDGNADYRLGSPVTARIAVSGQVGAKTVEVLNDDRTISMADGAIDDSFGPYELHIYRVAD